ncbi:MAG: hypothetical protein ACR2FV_01690 [Ornithinimicrobium sp.]|uniref:hypothetical protein n=1 Tax=Ornithinimicrobium sp. TaxID=1977084 RepID=UPI003D9BB133
MRVTSASHPLFGHLLAAHHFRRVDGVVFLVVDLPDGSPGTVRVDATDVLGAPVSEPVVTVLDGEGLRVLQALVARLPTRGCPAPEAGDDK